MRTSGGKWGLWAILAIAIGLLTTVGIRADEPCDGPCAGCHREEKDLLLERAPPCDPLGSLCDKTCIMTPPRCPWYIEEDAIALTRAVQGNTSFATFNDPNTLVLSSLDIDQPFKAGTKTVVGRNFVNTPYSVEVSYFWTRNFDDMESIRNSTTNKFGAPGNLFSPFGDLGLNPIVGLDYNDQATVHGFSSMQNGELNIRRLISGGDRLTTTFLIGLRYTGIDEEFDYFSHTNVPSVAAVPGVPVGTTSAFIDTHTNNIMFGPQVGLLFEFYLEHCWWVNTEMKGALYDDVASQDTIFRTTDNQGVATTSTQNRKQDVTAYSGEIDVTLVCRPCSWLSTRIGYQCFAVGGVALAEKNLSFNAATLALGPPDLNHHSTVVYHGPTAGFDIHW